MATAPVIQVLSKQNYEEHHYVSLPGAFPLPQLAPSSIRIKTSIFSLTTNNLTYARIGHLLGWWDVHPLPPSIPVEYSDPKLFGRISAWGYGTVIESNVSSIPVGTQFFGYLPIGNLPLDMEVQTGQAPTSPDIPVQFFEISKQRENLLPVYNRYMFYPLEAQKTLEQKQSQGYDAILRIFFETSYLINRFIFPWTPAEFIHPGNVNDNWTVEKGSLNDKSVVLMFADSGKTALALAYQLKNCRPAALKPQMVIGIGSNTSRAFSEGTGLYDKVLTYDFDSSDLSLELELTADTKVIVCEFGSRGGAAGRWASKLGESYDVVQLVIGGEVVADNPEKATEKLKARMSSPATAVNASVARSQALETIGEEKYFEEFFKEWQLFKERGLIRGLRLVWGESMKDVEKGWERLCKGQVRDEGLVFSLD